MISNGTLTVSDPKPTVMLASFPGSPLAPTKNKNGGARGEPGNKATVLPQLLACSTPPTLPNTQLFVESLDG